jgi:hypothetical protein
MGVDIGINMRLAATLFALSVTGPSDIASADWEFTTWGMTLEAVRKASPIELIQVSREVQVQSRTFANDGNSEILAAVNWTYMDQSCSAFFYFDVKTKKLVSVLQQFRTVKVADQLLRDLTKKYGEPTKKSELMPDLFTRTWMTPDDKIVFLRQGDTAQVNYFAR